MVGEITITDRAAEKIRALLAGGRAVICHLSARAYIFQNRPILDRNGPRVSLG